MLCRRVTLSPSSDSSTASPSSAPEAWPTARIFSQWSSSMIVTRRASSHQKSRSKNPKAVAALATKATEIAAEIRGIIPGRYSRAYSNAPFRNGQPPQTKIKVPRTGTTHPEPGNWGVDEPSHVWTISV